MKKFLCAGAVALATLGSLSNIPAASAYESGAFGADQAQLSAAIDIGRIKSVLHLTAEQERYWPPVEAALRDLAKKQSQSHTEQAGFVRRISHRVVSIVLNSAAVERLAVAARPLIAALNHEQMQAASGLAQEMGLGPVVAALR